MTIEEAIEIRERAKSLGLMGCCEQCRESLTLLDRLSTRPVFIMPQEPFPTYPTKARGKATLGPAMEDAARYLRRHIGVPR